MHILFNMMSFAVLGPWFERRVGSLQSLWTYFVVQVLLTTFALFIYFGIDQFYSSDAANVCIGGFSGTPEK